MRVEDVREDMAGAAPYAVQLLGVAELFKQNHSRTG
jgi:hypothetical protein